MKKAGSIFRVLWISHQKLLQEAMGNGWCPEEMERSADLWTTSQDPEGASPAQESHGLLWARVNLL